MQSRVGAAVKNMDAAPALMQRIVDIANASYSPLDQTVEVYSRNVAVLRDLGKGETEAADFTEALNHALVITATRGERAASVQNALSKAMAVGKLEADGLESVLANGGRVAEVLANKLGTNVNGLRAMASQGKITGSVIAEALIGSLEQLRSEAAEMPATVADAFTRLRTNLTAFIGQMDQSTGASQRVSAAIMLVADNIDVVTRLAAVAGIALMTAFAPAILTAMAAGLTAIGTAGVAAIGAITAAIAANPLGALAVGITTAVTAIYLFRNEIQNAIGIDVAGIVKNAGNVIINSFRAAFSDVTFVWNNFGTIMGAAVIGGVNAAIRAINGLLEKAAQSIDWLIDKVNAGLTSIGMAPMGKIGGGFSLGELDNSAAKDLSTANAAHAATIKGIMSSDPIGSLASAFKVATPEAKDFSEALNGVNTNLGTLGGAGGKAAKEAERLARAYDRIVESATEFIQEQELEARVIGMTEQAANALRYEMDLLNEAKRAGITLSEADRQGFKALGEAMAEAEAKAKAMRDALDFAKDVGKGFVNDFLQGIEQGKSVWSAFADAAVNALNKIADKLIDMAMDQMISGLFGSLFGGSMFPGGFGVATPGYTPYAKGGAFANGISGFSNTIVDRATPFRFANGAGIMGEAGPEAIMPLRRGLDGRLGVSAANNNQRRADNQNVHVTVGVSVDRNGNLQAYVKDIAQGEAGQAVQAGLTEYDRHVLPERFNQIARDPRARG